MSSTIPIDQIYQRGFELRCAGNYAEARQLFTELLRVDPRHLKARHQFALIQGFEGDFDGSLASLTALVSEAPHDLDIRYDLAMTQMMLGYYEEACSHLKLILNTNPLHEKALQQIAYC